MNLSRVYNDDFHQNIKVLTVRMFLIHPILQSAGFFIAFYVFALGISRFRTIHLKQKVLPLIHGIGNTIMLVLALFQIYTGIGVYRLYVLGL